MVLLGGIDFSKITPRSIKVEDMWGAISATSFSLVFTEAVLFVPDSTIFQAADFLYGDFQMKVLVYTKYGKYRSYFCPLWVGQPQYFDQNNQ